VKRLSTLVLAAAMLCGHALAQDYPTRTVTIVDAFPPGNPGDIVARLATPVLQAMYGQAFIVENQPGAGGNLAVGRVASARPDGYTVLTAPDTVFTVNPSLFTDGRINAMRDLVPVMRLSRGQLALACHPSVPVKSVDDLLALAKTRRMTYASGGNGSPAHLGTEYLKSVTGLSIDHVPYKGPAGAVNAIVAGEVDCGMIIASAVVGLASQNRVRVVMVTGSQRIGRLPEVPTAVEAGVKDFVVETLLTLSVPKGTPPDVVSKLTAGFSATLAKPDVARRLIEAEITPAPGEAAEVQREIAATAQRWGDLIARTGMKPN
jgi:tripartite-type tricarboxylate transporter receptor subunit TctC